MRTPILNTNMITHTNKSAQAHIIRWGCWMILALHKFASASVAQLFAWIAGFHICHKSMVFGLDSKYSSHLWLTPSHALQRRNDCRPSACRPSASDRTQDEAGEATFVATYMAINMRQGPHQKHRQRQHDRGNRSGNYPRKENAWCQRQWVGGNCAF